MDREIGPDIGLGRKVGTVGQLLVDEVLSRICRRVRLGATQYAEDCNVPADTARVQRVHPEIEPGLIGNATQDVIVDRCHQIRIAEVGRVCRTCFILIDEQSGRIRKAHAIRKGGTPEVEAHRVRCPVEIGDVKLDEAFEIGGRQAGRSTELLEVERRSFKEVRIEIKQFDPDQRVQAIAVGAPIFDHGGVCGQGQRVVALRSRENCRVDAGPAIHEVVAAPAFENVIAAFTDKRVVASLTLERVIVRPTVDQFRLIATAHEIVARPGENTAVRGSAAIRVHPRNRVRQRIDDDDVVAIDRVVRPLRRDLGNCGWLLRVVDAEQQLPVQ